MDVTTTFEELTEHIYTGTRVKGVGPLAGKGFGEVERKSFSFPEIDVRWDDGSVTYLEGAKDLLDGIRVERDPWPTHKRTPLEVDSFDDPERPPLLLPEPSPNGATTTLPTKGEDRSPTKYARKLTLTPLTDIKFRPVRWLWNGRVPQGELTLLAGREGLGKSTLAYQMAADVTNGTLPGDYLGQPRNVLIAATEDSWETTVGPRLVAAGADIGRVFKMSVELAEGVSSEVDFPVDNRQLQETLEELAANDMHVGMILLDPLVSRLNVNLDTHKDAEVRQALEPLVKIAHDAETAIVGIIHFNKQKDVDMLSAITGARAFTATARAVMVVLPDPDDPENRLAGTPKSNLGSTDMSTLTFHIESATVDSEAGPLDIGRLVWGETRPENIREAYGAASLSDDERVGREVAKEWLVDFLTERGGIETRDTIMAAAAGRNIKKSTLDRARQAAGVKTKRMGSGKDHRSYWHLKGTQPWEKK